MRAGVNGIELNYNVVGDGPVIVLTHGIGGTGDDLAALAERLAAHYRVVTYDVRGFGQSSRPADGYTLKQFAADLAGLLDQLGINQAIIGGHSMGGTITQRFILDYPERTRAAIIISTSSQVNEKGKAFWQGQADFIAEHGMAAFVRRSRPAEYTEEYLQDHPEIIEAEERRIRNNPDGRVYAQAARAVSDYYFTDELKSVTVPTLVMVGSADTQTPPGGSVIISRAITGSTLHILDGVTHGLPREIPDKAATLILSFLAEHGLDREPAGSATA